MWRQKKAVRSKAFVVDSEPCETYLEGDQTIRSALRPHRLGAFLLPLIHLSFLFAPCLIVLQDISPTLSSGGILLGVCDVQIACD